LGYIPLKAVNAKKLILTATGNISDFLKRQVDGFYHRKDGVTPKLGSPFFILAIQILNPFHRLGAGDLAKIALGGLEV
jgi:hypothetical protein